MARYVDGFVIPIAKDKIDQYRDIAQKCGEIWKEHGALDYYEAVGDDLDVKEHSLVPFTDLAKTAEGETVVFSWIVFESKEQRDKVNAAVMNDPRLKEIMSSNDPHPFDCKRMAYGGFKTIVQL